MADAAGDADPQALEVEAPGGGVIRRGLVAALVVGLDDAAGVRGQHLVDTLQGLFAVLALPIAGVELLARGQAQAGEAVLFGHIQLAQGDGVDASADHQQAGVQLRHGDRPALGHLHQVGQQRRKAGTACHQAGPAIPEQGAARGRKVVEAPGVKDQDALLLRHSLTLFQSRKAVGRHIGLLPDELSHPGVAHRLEGVDAEGALCHRHAADIMYSIPGHTVDLGEGRQERQLALPAGFEQGRKLCADVSAQSGVCLFIDAENARTHRIPGQFCNDGIGLCSGQMACLGVHHQHSGVIGCKIHLLSDHDAGGDAAGSKLDTRVQRTCKVICKDQQKQHRLLLLS